MKQSSEVVSEIHNIFKIEKFKCIRKRIKKTVSPKVHSQNLQRKNRSLGYLCQNFIKLYSKYQTAIINIDECANELKVERRRIYDIINILDCFCCFKKKGKNCYYWLGCYQIINFLISFQIIPPLPANLEIPFLHSTITSSHPLVPNSQIEEYKNKQFRKERSLGRVCQQFVLLFASSPLKYLYLDYISRELSSNDLDECNKKTKIRRIYDIANVFQSIGIIKKIHNPESKTIYKWEGVSGFLSFLNNGHSNTLINENSILEENKIPINASNSYNQNPQILIEGANMIQLPQDIFKENIHSFSPEKVCNPIIIRDNIELNYINRSFNSESINKMEPIKIKKKRKKNETNWPQDINLLIEAVNQLENK